MSSECILGTGVILRFKPGVGNAVVLRALKSDVVAPSSPGDSISLNTLVLFGLVAIETDLASNGWSNTKHAKTNIMHKMTDIRIYFRISVGDAIGKLAYI
jgi:hypothetical protein